MKKLFALLTWFIFISFSFWNSLLTWSDSSSTWSNSLLTWSDSLYLEGSAYSWDIDLITWDALMNDYFIDDEIKDEISQKASAIENFRKRQWEIINEIYQNSSFWILLDIDKAKEQIEEISSEFRDIQEDFKETSEKKKEIDKKYIEIRDTLKMVLIDMKSTEENLKNRIIKINLYTKQLANLEEDVKFMNTEIKDTKKILVKYTDFLYKLNNDYYWEDLKIDDLKLLVKSDDISNSLSLEEIVKLLAVKLDDLLKLLDIKHKKYIRNHEKLEKLKIKYSYEVKEYNKEMDLLEQQKKYVLDLLRYLKKDKDLTDEKYLELFWSKKELKKQIMEMITLTKQKIENVDINNGFDLSKLLKYIEKPDSDKFLSWPLLPVKKITAFYHDNNYIKHFWVDHYALDLASPQWNEIYAPANSIVYKVRNVDSVWLNWIILIHKYGYVTVYLHMNQVFVKEWEFLKRGQIIWLSWWKPWTRWAWLLSSWPHLHFEVYKNWKRVDPLDYMDLSILTKKESLPVQYHVKYIKDKFSRDLDYSNIKYMEWDTLEKRRENFLTKVWHWPYASLQLWKDASQDNSIDIDLWICIAYAETSLGRNFASSYNVGNVGNNDRWDRVAYPTPISWAKAIYYTLENRYLSKHYTINNLSRYWNPDESIYASDPVHWQNNVIRCLSTIKWFPVPNDYPFRKYGQ